MFKETTTVRTSTIKVTFSGEEIEDLLRTAAGVPPTATVDLEGDIEYLKGATVEFTTAFNEETPAP